MLWCVGLIACMEKTIQVSINSSISMPYNDQYRKTVNDIKQQNIKFCYIFYVLKSLENCGLES